MTPRRRSPENCRNGRSAPRRPASRPVSSASSRAAVSSWRLLRHVALAGGHLQQFHVEGGAVLADEDDLAGCLVAGAR